MVSELSGTRNKRRWGCGDGGYSETAGGGNEAIRVTPGVLAGTVKERGAS